MERDYGNKIIIAGGLPMYTLMNKDKKLLDFMIDGESVLEECRVINQYNDTPTWMSTITEWVANRSAAKHREHIRRLLLNTGGETLSGFIRLTHCLSINDTLWIKSEKEQVVWNDVSLYKNPFDDVISRLSFDGNGLFGQKLSTTSPELTTNGAFDKCWIQDESGIYLIKTGSAGASNAGREPYSEVLASQVYERICSSKVIYTLSHYHGKAVSKCSLFTDEQYGYKPVSVYNLVGKTVAQLLREFDKFDSADLFREMIVADAVTINQDRHFGNFGFLINNDTFERVTMAPVFDFNLSMFPYADWVEGFPDMDDWIAKRGPQIGPDYYSTAQALMTPAIRSELVNLKDLELKVETDDRFDEARLKIANQFKNIQIDRILGNRRQFDFLKYAPENEEEHLEEYSE